MENITEVIKCPECGCIQEAMVDSSSIFDTYIHDCIECSYTIMESEWEIIK